MWLLKKYGFLILTRPDFVFVSHNSGYAGMYYYINPPLAEMFPQLQRLSSSLGFSLAKGEPEAPWLIQYARRVSCYTHIDPITMMSARDTTFDFLRNSALNKTIFLMEELLSFLSPTIPNDTRAGALHISVFYKMLIISMLDRAILSQLNQPSSDVHLLENAHIELQSDINSCIEEVE